MRIHLRGLILWTALSTFAVSALGADTKDGTPDEDSESAALSDSTSNHSPTIKTADCDDAYRTLTYSLKWLVIGGPVVAAVTGTVIRIEQRDRFQGQLYQAADRGDLEAIKRIDRWELVGPEWRNQALIAASGKGHLDVVKYLLETGANANTGDGRALWEAVQSGHIELGKLLVEKGANINTGHGYPLYRALDLNRYDFAEWLIEKGADVNVPNGELLDNALVFDDVAGAKFLLEHGARPTQKHDLNRLSSPMRALLSEHRNAYLDLLRRSRARAPRSLPHTDY